MQLVMEGKPQELIEEVLSFSTSVGLPVTLAEVGLRDVPLEMLEQVAARATAKGETIHNEPFDVRSDMVTDGIQAADAIGRAWKERKKEVNVS